MVNIIQSLAIRGAPLIGIGAALCLAKYIHDGACDKEIAYASKQLSTARPTAINLNFAVSKVYSNYLKYGAQKAIKTAYELFDNDANSCEKIASHGSQLIKANSRVLTYCNTGSLATAGIGTALGIITTAHQQENIKHVYACETRPLLQGGRLTAWELKRQKISFSLLCDNAAGQLMQDGKVDAVITGADRVVANGDTANKVGTSVIAVLCQYFNIPFYVALPSSTFDFSLTHGKDIQIEQRNPEEVLKINSQNNLEAFNPAFDITPSALITSFVTEQGIFSPSELTKLQN